jgi:hypothetical protein
MAIFGKNKGDKEKAKKVKDAEVVHDPENVGNELQSRFDQTQSKKRKQEANRVGKNLDNIIEPKWYSKWPIAVALVVGAIGGHRLEDSSHDQEVSTLRANAANDLANERAKSASDLADLTAKLTQEKDAAVLAARRNAPLPNNPTREAVIVNNADLELPANYLLSMNTPDAADVLHEAGIALSLDKLDGPLNWGRNRTYMDGRTFKFSDERLLQHPNAPLKIATEMNRVAADPDFPASRQAAVPRLIFHFTTVNDPNTGDVIGFEIWRDPTPDTRGGEAQVGPTISL